VRRRAGQDSTYEDLKDCEGLKKDEKDNNHVVGVSFFSPSSVLLVFQTFVRGVVSRCTLLRSQGTRRIDAGGVARREERGGERDGEEEHAGA